jgi:hypothetical protein
MFTEYEDILVFVKSTCVYVLIRAPQRTASVTIGGPEEMNYFTEENYGAVRYEYALVFTGYRAGVTTTRALFTPSR